MFRNLVTSLIKHEKIISTSAKVKDLRRIAEKLVTLAKKGSIHARRLVARDVQDKEALDKLFSLLATRYQSRSGGYTRITKYGLRRGDAAPLSIIEFIEEQKGKGQKKKKKKTAPAQPVKTASPEESSQKVQPAKEQEVTDSKEDKIEE